MLEKESKSSDDKHRLFEIKDQQINELQSNVKKLIGLLAKAKKRKIETKPKEIVHNDVVESAHR